MAADHVVTRPSRPPGSDSPGGRRLPGEPAAASPVAWHALPGAEVLALLRADPDQGLAAGEARHRLAEGGPNRIADRPDTPLWRLALRQFRSLVVLLLLAAAAIAALLGERVEAVAILVALVLNAGIGFGTEWHARRSLARLRSLAVPHALARRDGRVTRLPAADLVAGDVVVLEAGAQVPADCRLIRTAALRVSEATLTGESEPVEKNESARLAPETPLAERRTIALPRHRGGGQRPRRRHRHRRRHRAGTHRPARERSGRADDAARAPGRGPRAPADGARRRGLRRRRRRGQSWLGPPRRAHDAHAGDRGQPRGRRDPRGAPGGDRGGPRGGTLAAGPRRGAPSADSRRSRRSRSTTVICADKTGTMTENQMTVTRVATWMACVVAVTGGGRSPASAFLEVRAAARPAPGPGAPPAPGGRDARERRPRRAAGGRPAAPRRPDRGRPRRARPQGRRGSPGRSRASGRGAARSPSTPRTVSSATFHESAGGDRSARRQGRTRRASSSTAPRTGKRPPGLSPSATPTGEALREAEPRPRRAGGPGPGARLASRMGSTSESPATQSETRLDVFLAFVGLEDPVRPGVREAIARLAGTPASARSCSPATSARPPRPSDGSSASDADAIRSRVSPEGKLALGVSLQQVGEGRCDDRRRGERRAGARARRHRRGDGPARHRRRARGRGPRLEPTTISRRSSWAVEEGRVVYANLRKVIRFLFSCNLSEISHDLRGDPARPAGPAPAAPRSSGSTWSPTSCPRSR